MLRNRANRQVSLKMLSFLVHLPGPFKSIAERFDRSPIDSVEYLNRFARTRASYVAQTSLFDYLKARMGTQFREYFMDDAFSRAIHDSSVKVFVSCLSDLTVHAVAVVADPQRLQRSECEAMARQCFDRGMREGLADVDSQKIPADARSRFDGRLRETDWPQSATGDAAFVLSPADLVRHAPVIDEFKRLDRQIVATSIGHKWREVRNTFRKRAVPERIAADWRAIPVPDIRPRSTGHGPRSGS